MKSGWRAALLSTSAQTGKVTWGDFGWCCMRLLSVAALLVITVESAMPWTLLLVLLDVPKGAIALGMLTLTITAYARQRTSSGSDGTDL